MKNYIWKILILVIAVIIAGSFEKSEANTNGVRLLYFLQIKGAGYDYKVLLNGTEILNRDNSIRSLEVNPYLRHGKNIFEINYNRIADSQSEQVTTSYAQKNELELEFYRQGWDGKKEVLLSYSPSVLNTPVGTWQKDIRPVNLSIRGSGQSRYELESWVTQCEIDVNLNKRWMPSIQLTSSMEAIPVDALQNGENVLEVRTRNITSSPSYFPPQWTVTIFKRWLDGGFEPIAHLESYKPAPGDIKNTKFSVKDLLTVIPYVTEHLGELFAQDKEKINSLIRQLYAAYEGHDVDKILALEGDALVAMSERYGMTDHQKMINSQKDTLTKAFNSSWKLEPLANDFTFSIDGDFVKVSAAQPIIAASFIMDGGQAQMKLSTLYFGRDKGEWRLAKWDF